MFLAMKYGLDADRANMSKVVFDDVVNTPDDLYLTKRLEVLFVEPIKIPGFRNAVDPDTLDADDGSA